MNTYANKKILVLTPKQQMMLAKAPQPKRVCKVCKPKTAGKELE
jgi:hypothetical protein